MITVYGRATSSNVQAVWGIGELGLAYERLDYGLKYGGTDTPEYLAMNPHGLVPTIRDGGAFWPADPVTCARVDMWAEWGKADFSSDFTLPIFWSRVRTAALDRDGAALAHALAKFDGYLGHLETQLGGNPYVTGADFTLADIVIGHVLFRYFDIDIPRKDRPVIEAYYARLKQRPAFREHVMVSYDMLRAEGVN
ncbi:MAG: glutathione S-transferase C-terminal domain-containing protein [Marinosulfonomonas sp.]|nr:glutathione S-transferase C-terminal domain-containing protein [Marinosulfonomonas sp.]